MKPFPPVVQLGVETKRDSTRLAASPLLQACERRHDLSARFEAARIANFACPALPNPSPNQTMPIMRNMVRMSSKK
jgi:hypothetical protein